MTKATSSPESIFRKRGGVLRMSEALAAGLNRRNLYALRDAGTITQLSRGVYAENNVAVIEAMFREVCGLSVVDDGLRIDASTLVGSRYQGRRRLPRR